jgi:hypothetical protein
MVVMITLVALVGSVAAIVMAQHDIGDTLSGDPMSCRFRPHGYAKSRIEFWLDDAATIERLVLKPLREAERIDNPDKYEAFGGLRVQFADDRTVGIYLFAPIGYFAIGDDYYRANLNELFTFYAEVLDEEISTIREYIEAD